MKPCDPSTITFFYEPMHEVERLFNEGFSGSQESGSKHKDIACWSFLIITVLLLLNNLGLNYQNTTTRMTKGNHRHHGHNGQGKGGRVCFFSTPIFHLLTFYLCLELPQ